MFKVVKKVIQYPRLTVDYPKKSFDSSLFVSMPEINSEKCTNCGECLTCCPSHAIVMDIESNKIKINYNECIFCALCEDVCSIGAVKMSNKFELAESNLKERINKIFGRSLHIREVDAGSCNGCDYEINALNNPLNDVERLGIHFVASPRHADMLLVTGCGTRNMQSALIKTYNATPEPKIVVAVGACACSGGIFKDCYAANKGIASIIPVDVYIPGCPPRPQAILYGIMKALDKVK